MPAPVLMRLTYRLLYPTGDLVLCQHRAMAEEMTTQFGVAAERVAVLPNPVDSARLRALPPCREPGPGRPFFAAGRLTHAKGFDRLIDMFATSGAGDRLCIFGDGPDRASLEDRPRERGAAGRPDPVRRLRLSALVVFRRRRCGARRVPMGGSAERSARSASVRNAGGRYSGIGQYRGGRGRGAAGSGDRRRVGGCLPNRPHEGGPAIPVNRTRPSLLPEQYERESVIEQFTALVGLS